MNVRIDGAQYAYRTGGSGRPLLLLHGFPFTSEIFWPQLDAPAGGARLICPDHRGFGGSELRPGVATMEALAKDALALLDELGVEQAVVGGLSMGGYAAMALLRLAPARVAGLLLIDTQATAEDAAGRERRETVARQLEQNGMGAFTAGMLPRLLAKDAKPYARARVEAMMKAVNPAAAAAASRGMGARADQREVLARFDGPALVVVGEHDELTPPAKARELAASLPGAKLLVVPGAGHLSNVEAPHPVNAAITELMASVP